MVNKFFSLSRNVIDAKWFNEYSKKCLSKSKLVHYLLYGVIRPTQDQHDSISLVNKVILWYSSLDDFSSICSILCINLIAMKKEEILQFKHLSKQLKKWHQIFWSLRKKRNDFTNHVRYGYLGLVSV